MLSNQILVFDIESEYGHFRKFNTTTSPLTYSIPTRPAIAGILGAVLGIERETAPGKFKEVGASVAEMFAKSKAAIAVQLLNATKKVNVGFNLIDTKKSFINIAQRTQIEFELLKEPAFKIFVNVEDEQLLQELADRLEKNQTFFTPYLGLSQFTATLSFKGISKLTPQPMNGFQEVITAVNLSATFREEPIKFDYSGNFKYTSDTMPVEMLGDRTVIEYSEVIVETNGKPMQVQSHNIYLAEGFGNILFL